MGQYKGLKHLDTREMEIQKITKSDFDQILSQLSDFWGDRSTEVVLLHHPLFLYEFGDTALVMKENEKVLGYLLGFMLPHKKLGYIHFIGTRLTRRKKGIAKSLYSDFIENCKKAGCNSIKAITPLKNTGSIEFHKTLGFTLIGDPDTETGIPVIKNYNGLGGDRVVFVKNI